MSLQHLRWTILIGTDPSDDRATVFESTFFTTTSIPTQITQATGTPCNNKISSTRQDFPSSLLECTRNKGRPGCCPSETVLRESLPATLSAGLAACLKNFSKNRLPSPAPKPLRMKAMPLAVELGMLLVLLPPSSTREGREHC